MRVAALLEARRRNWHELELLCTDLERRRLGKLGGQQLTHFAALYRAACADLALADAYQLPAETVAYLHHLVGRGHNQLYRSRRFRLQSWLHELLVAVPKRLYSDNSLRLAFVLFWGFFLLAMYLAYRSPTFAEQIIGKEQLTGLEEMYAQPFADRDPNERAFMVGFYIMHNTGIGLQCFAMGLLAGVGGILLLLSNALQLGASFGHMATLDTRENFFHFVTAHGPFELTAIVLSAAAGMRLGFALVHTQGWTRRESLQRAAREAMPSMGAAMVLFSLAALLEGFLSPSAAPYLVKAFTAAFSSLSLLFYFVLLGQPESVFSPRWEFARGPWSAEKSAAAATGSATRPRSEPPAPPSILPPGAPHAAR